MRKCFSMILVLLFLPCLTFGATYYIRDDGSADIDSTSSCNAPNNAANVSVHNSANFSAGDIVIICHQGGPFDGGDEFVVPSSGSKSNPITYQGEPGAGNSFHAEGDLDNNQIFIEGNNKGYIIIKDLRVKEYDTAFYFHNNSDNIIIQNNYVQDCNHNAVRSYHRVSDCAADKDCNDDWVIQDNEFSRNGSEDGDAQIEIESANGWRVTRNKIYGGDISGYACPDEADDGPIKAGVDGIFLVDASQIIIEYNEIYEHNNDGACSGDQHGENGIDLKNATKQITIRYNQIYGNKASKEGYGLIWHYCNQTDEDLEVYGNIFMGNNIGIIVYPRANETCNNANIYENHFKQNKRYGVYLSYTSTGRWDDINLHDNVFDDESVDSDDSYETPLRVRGSNGTQSLIVKKNIFKESGQSNRRMAHVSKGSTSHVDFRDNIGFDSDGPAKIFWGTNDLNFESVGSNNTCSQVPLSVLNSLEAPKNLKIKN